MTDLRELNMADIPEAIRADVETLRAFCANGEAAWSSLCAVMRALAAQPAHYCKNCLGVDPDSCVFRAQPAPGGEVALPAHPFAVVSAGAEGWDHAEEAAILAYGNARAAAAVAVVPVTTPNSCDGCQHLCTERWMDYLDNDETDSGTIAKCMHSLPAKEISVYWHAHHAVPQWCPLAAAPQPATVKQDLTVQQPEADTGEDYSDCCDTPAYCSSVRRCTAKDAAQPKPAKGGAVCNVSIPDAPPCPVIFADSPARAWAGGWKRGAEAVAAMAAPAGSASADYECRAHECRRVRVEMQAEIDRLRALVAGSGEAVAYTVLHTASASAIGYYRIEIKTDNPPGPGTKLYAGAVPADAEALIEDVNDIIALGRVLRQGGPDPIDLQELSDALSQAVQIAERIDSRLSGGEGV